MEIRTYLPADEAAVIALWQACDLLRPWNDPHRDIARKLAVQPELFIVGLLDEELVATAMAGYEGHRGWIYYLAVAPGHQRKGFGQMMMEQVEALLRAAGCPKLNLQVRASNQTAVAFYRRQGYAVDDVISLGKRLEHDNIWKD